MSEAEARTRRIDDIYAQGYRLTNISESTHA
jgi:hypothetical protein